MQKIENRVYISGAISGTNDYMKRFAKAQCDLIAQGYDVINPVAIKN